MKLTLVIGLLSIIAAVQANSANTTSDTNATSAWNGPVNITEPTPGTKWEAGSLHTIHWTVLNNDGGDDDGHGNDTNGGGGGHGNDTDGGGGGGHGNDTDGGHGNDTDTNSTQTDHLSIQLAVGGNIQAVDLVFPLAHNVSKSNGTTQIMVPQHIAGGKNFTLAVGQPDQGVSLVSGIDIDNKNGTHDKNGTVNPDASSPTNSTT
ncbi:unnamed protein product [Absidia cylindrospora]